MTVLERAVNSPAAWSDRAYTELSSHEAAGWSEKGQTLRFLAVLEHLDLSRGDTVLDFGCGTGRFSAFLPHHVDYTGFDTAPGMIERARADHPRETFVDAIPSVIYDHVVAVGPFNLPSDIVAFEQVEWLWRMTRRSLVISLYRGDDPRCERYDLPTVTWWVERLGCDRFTIDTTHLDNDLILGLYR